MLNNWTFSYTACRADELFLDPGSYEFEVWGASGGVRGSNIPRGLGGYARGIITLRGRTKVYVRVGSQGSDSTGGSGTFGCNGGGYASHTHGRAGGGATDIRLINDSPYSRVIVAGGGGGGSDEGNDAGGHGGGLNGGDGGVGIVRSNSYAGKGGSQLTETTACADGTLNKCPKGTFGYGGNTTGNYAGAGGGGWFGGSASNYECGGGGGSGYVLTSSSAKVGGYLLGEEFYLTNTSLFSGSQSFPKPDKSGYETGHFGDGYAIIRSVVVLDPPPVNSSILDFSFTRSGELVVKDESGKFSFNEYGTYTSFVKPGNYLIYANGSSCGQSILAEYRTRKYETMNINFNNSIIVYVNNEVILQAPGYGTGLNTTIGPKLRIVFNYSMHEYQCLGVDHSELTISYLNFNHISCKCLNNMFSIASVIVYVLICS
jgi:hypothetical protein